MLTPCHHVILIIPVVRIKLAIALASMDCAITGRLKLEERRNKKKRILTQIGVFTTAQVSII